MSELSEIRAELDDIDRQMAQLYERRMGLMKDVAAFKKSRNLKVFDEKRERGVLDRNTSLVNDPLLKPYYRDFMRFIMAQGKDMQYRLLDRGGQAE